VNFKINSRTSDIVITVYVVLTLFYRIKFENEAGVTTIQSLVIGLSLIAIPWFLIKLKILNPNWFGLFNTKSVEK
jgi:hypothetical protein